MISNLRRNKKSYLIKDDDEKMNKFSKISKNLEIATVCVNGWIAKMIKQESIFFLIEKKITSPFGKGICCFRRNQAN